MDTAQKIALKNAERAQYLKTSWLEETAFIVLSAALGHWALSFLSPTLATTLATAFLGWTLVAGNIFTIVHSLAHQGEAKGYPSRLLKAAHLRHGTHHELETDPRFVLMAPTLVLVSALLNALAIMVITRVAWLLGWAWLIIMISLSAAAIQFYHAEKDGHSQYHGGTETPFVRMVSSIIHKWHHDDRFEVTALYPHQCGGWYLVPKGALYVLAVVIAILEGLVAWIWPAFGRWLDEQVAARQGEYNAVIAKKAAKAADADVGECDPSTEDAQPA